MPYEAAGSLRFTNQTKILIAVGEVEFEGTPTARDIYLENTPIQDVSGSYNFTNVKWEWRPGPLIRTTYQVSHQSINTTQLSSVRVCMAWVTC